MVRRSVLLALSDKPDLMWKATEDVRSVDRLLEERNTELFVLYFIESAAGVLRADDIAAVDATAALLFGAGDLAADIGATRTSEGTGVLSARERTGIAASGRCRPHRHRLTVYTDSDGLRGETTFDAQLDKDGKMAIHPDQVPVINDAFTPETRNSSGPSACLTSANGPTRACSRSTAR